MGTDFSHLQMHVPHILQNVLCNLGVRNLLEGINRKDSFFVLFVFKGFTSVKLKFHLITLTTETSFWEKFPILMDGQKQQPDFSTSNQKDMKEKKLERTEQQLEAHFFNNINWVT